MNDFERIISVCKIDNLTLNALAKRIGLKTPQRFYDIKKGKHGISKDLAEKIKSLYLNINIPWLLTGEGEMLLNLPSETTNFTSNDIDLNKIFEIIEHKDKQLDRVIEAIEKRDEKINTLIASIEQRENNIKEIISLLKESQKAPSSNGENGNKEAI